MNKTLRYAIIIGGIVAAAPYGIAAWNEKPVDDEFRSQAPGEFVQLTDGKVHYRWLGDDSGEIVVLIHGVSVPQYVFAQAADALVSSGYKVLLFDYFGHGFSDRPTASYDSDFFVRQMVELFDALDLDQPVNIGALSMGGVITADFTARHPERVKSLTLFAPAGLRLVNETDSTFVSVLKSPVFGNWLWRILGRGIYYPDDDEETVDADFEADSGEILHGDPETQADYSGYLMAMRQIFRNLPLHHRDDLYRRVGQSSVPVLGIFGSADATVDFESAQLLGELVPQSRIEVLDGGTHHMNIHRWRAIHALMVSFIRYNNGESGEEMVSPGG